MSFRIEDILKDKKCSFKKEGQISVKMLEEGYVVLKAEDKVFHPNTLLDRDRDKMSGYSRINANLVDYQAHCLGSQSLEYTRDSFTSNFVPYQPIKSCYPRALPSLTNDKIYPTPYIYPEKIYSPTNYSHVLPLNFSIYSHYSKRRNQVRFSTTQTKALEHKFSWQKYLSPEERKLLAYTLKLSDRQVIFFTVEGCKACTTRFHCYLIKKPCIFWYHFYDVKVKPDCTNYTSKRDKIVKTWFQNRRAKWRRNVGGPSTSDVKSDISNPLT